ncbi:site-specific DNA-methyltransferase [uncultured Peptoniphilus sp.]|uniref:site-specific DNA-methyltransferase n=1 Tax=uncultured Peptoniphilus sp. TaxID=254354 RepID=UPI002609B21F|nr:site-specific DNA-methyltransferase [uncultured Peptoniphilus sp.]
MQKLEITWIGKGKEPAVEPRILLHEPSKDYGDPNTENMLIHGDNLLALKALEQQYTGKVKCIYIDPPYNTGAAFEHYDDNLEHSIWLKLMKSRLEILKNLLAPEGAICVQIDNVEMAYLKVLMDEVFTRKNHINTISVKTKVAGVSGSNLGKSLQDNVEYILLYAKDLESFKLNVVPQKKQELMDYIQSYEDQGKSWKYTTVLKRIDDGDFVKEFPAGNGDMIKLYKHENFEFVSVNQIAKDEFDGNTKKAYYSYIEKILRTTNAQTSIRTKVIEETEEFGGKGMFSIEYTPIKGKNAGKLTRFYYKDNNLVAWLKDVVDTDGKLIYKLDNSGNLWDDIQYNNLTKEGNVQFPNGKKPESLVGRIIEMLSVDGDIVLDSFLGSGTTSATAHKLNRKWIGIELGEHCYTHCIPRLNAVIDGTDNGGITKDVNWQGGGGYKFYELAPSLIEKDKYGNPVISSKYNLNMLIAAIAKLNGYNYSPDPDVFWKQGYSQDKSYIYVTTNYMDSKMLDSIYSDLGMMETLLICAPAFDIGLDKRYDNIQVKKIPQSVLDKCEYGVDNYNLNVVDIPIIDEEEWEDD